MHVYVVYLCTLLPNDMTNVSAFMYLYDILQCVSVADLFT